MAATVSPLPVGRVLSGPHHPGGGVRVDDDMTTVRRLTAVAVVLGLGLAVAAPAGAAAAPRCSGSHWVGAWGAAPAYAAAPGHAGQTLRMMVTPHAGGRLARVRLTNRYGTAPVTFAAVRLARRASGAGVVAGMSRPVRFGGRRSVTIARGADAVSDPVRIRFRAFQQLSVSVYARGATGPATTHPLASEPSTYVASGDHTADRGGAAFGDPIESWPFLNGVDVLARARTGAVVALGDSITDGALSTVARPSGARDTRWPDVLARRLVRAGRPLSVVNQGISGNRVRLDALPTSPEIFGPSALSRLDGDVVATSGVTDVLILEGINDIGQTPPATAAQVIAGLQQVVARLKVAGLRVHLGTLTPAGGTTRATYGSPAADLIRRTVNRWIRRSRLPDTVVDFDRAVRDPSRPSRLRPAYDGGDHLHPNARGYRAMGDAVRLSALHGTACATAS
jgi:lysophospholipase L1-like esterase